LAGTVGGVISRQLVGVSLPPTINDPWGELSRLSFDEDCLQHWRSGPRSRRRCAPGRSGSVFVSRGGLHAVSMFPPSLRCLGPRAARRPAGPGKSSQRPGPSDRAACRSDDRV